MVSHLNKSRFNGFTRGMAFIVIVAFLWSYLLSTPVYAQNYSVVNLPLPGAMVNPSPGFEPVLIKGMTIHPDNPLNFEFIIDSGNSDLTQDEIKQESERLVKYFMAALTIPKDDLWVNLSPYENERIIPDELAKTELGRDLLAQDYLLKQLSSSLIHPDSATGKEFWDRVYAKAYNKFGTTEVPINTFNKVWILPENADVYEYQQTVYITSTGFKVMLDEDYLALDNNVHNKQLGTDRVTRDTVKDSASLSSQIVREIILPEIEREVNEGRNFAPLRQIYHSLILAKWYKETVTQGILSEAYVDQKKTGGIELEDKKVKKKIYDQYMAAAKQGVFNFIKEDYDKYTQEAIPRKYFAGGIAAGAGGVNHHGKGSKGGGHGIKDATKAFILSVGLAGAVAGGLKALEARPAGAQTQEQTITADSGQMDAPSLKDKTAQDPTVVMDTDEVSLTIEKLKDKRSYTERVRACQKLGELKDVRAIEPLLFLLNDDSYSVREAAHETLEKLGASKAQMTKGYLMALVSGQGYDDILIAKALVDLGDVTAILTFMEENDLSVDATIEILEILLKIDRNSIGRFFLAYYREMVDMSSAEISQKVNLLARSMVAYSYEKKDVYFGKKYMTDNSLIVYVISYLDQQTKVLSPTNEVRNQFYIPLQQGIKAEMKKIKRYNAWTDWKGVLILLGVIFGSALVWVLTFWLDAFLDSRAKFHSGGSGEMGRWKYESISYDPKTGKMTLHDATRIPHKDKTMGKDGVEEEFLIDGENSPRDIVLQTRDLTQNEMDKILDIAGDLDLMRLPKVIVRDHEAIKHRIYGMAAEGQTFIREDIIKEGNQDQIKEAMDHERLELIMEDHDQIRDVQYKGEPGQDLRVLITKLSTRDKADMKTAVFQSRERLLQSTRASVQSARDFKEGLLAGKRSDEGPKTLHVVMGNEAADLDSTVSAIVHAQVMNQVNKDPNTVFVPLVNSSYDDMRLQAEVTTWLSHYGFSPEQDLLYNDTFDIVGVAQAAGRNTDLGYDLKVTLMDHNKLKQGQQPLWPHVERVIDHHPDAGIWQKQSQLSSERVRIERIGSNSTLVAQEVSQLIDLNKEPLLAVMLLTTIVRDTLNFDAKGKETGRWNDTDTRITRQLLEVSKPALARILPSGLVSEQQYYDAIFDITDQAAFDTESFSTRDFYRSDYKEFAAGAKEGGQPYRFGIAYVKSRKNINGVLEKGDLVAGINDFTSSLTTEEESDIFIGMPFDHLSMGPEATRQLFFYSRDAVLLNDLVAFLKRESTFDLKELTQYTDYTGQTLDVPKTENLMVFTTSPENVRKTFAPVIERFFEQRQASPDSGHGGIDLNQIDLKRKGAGILETFSPESVQPSQDIPISGLKPVIINLVPINSVLPLLGLKEGEDVDSKEDDLELSLAK